MIHHYPATGVGVLILVLAVMGWKAWVGRGRETQHHPINPWWPTLTLVWVCIQALLAR